MDSNTHSAFITGNVFSAFVDGIPDKCDHDTSGDIVMQSASGKMIYWHTYRQWAHLTTEARRELILDYHGNIDDPIVMETSSCSKCKKPFSPPMFDI